MLSELTTSPTSTQTWAAVITAILGGLAVVAKKRLNRTRTPKPPKADLITRTEFHAGPNKPASTFSSVVPASFPFPPLSTINFPLSTSRRAADLHRRLLLPGTTPGPGQNPLPSDLEQAAVEQVAYWFQIRDKLGLKTRWPHGGTYEGFFPFDLLPNVQTVLKRYERYSL